MVYLAPIDERFDTLKVVSYARDRWHYSFHISAFYVVSVFALRRYMQNRQRYNLRVPLFLWSLTLAVFSILGFLGAGLPHVAQLVSEGWERSVCEGLMATGQPSLWAFLFCFSKLPELVDTYFIVLRKQKLIFLHWYHHVTVFIYCWYHYATQIHPAQWFITLNYFVHAIMYSYYALRASGRVRPPIWVNMMITSLQLLQMVFGVYLNVFVYNKMSSGSWYCDGNVETSYFYVYCAFSMYFSYFVLFAHYFWTTYFSKPSAPQPPTRTATDTKTTSTSQPILNGHIAVATKALQCNGMTRRHCSNGSTSIKQ